MTEPSNPYSAGQQSGNPIGLAAPVVASKRFFFGTVLVLMCLAILVYAIYQMVDGLNALTRAPVPPSVSVKPSVFVSEMVFCLRICFTSVAGSLLGVWLMVSGYRKK
jgi:hypothetical protein